MVLGNPETIGRYALQDNLGAGGFATVYRAYDPVLDRAVALKVLHPHLARDGATRDRFVLEGRALARIRHPNIVQVFDAGEADGLVYLAMELVEGVSLATLIRERGRVTLPETAAIADEVAAALAAVHRRGLVHCDVKPANILMEQDGGRVVLLDLGVARRVDETVSTSGGWMAGTPAYMAPEQISPGHHISPATDVYQLGATVHALLAGEPPFTGEATRVMYAVVNHDPPDLAQIRPGLSPAVADLVARAMAKDPAVRPESPRAFAGRLHELAGLKPLPARGLAVAPARTEAATRLSARTAVTPADGAAATRAETERVERPAPAPAGVSGSPPRWRWSLPLLLGSAALLAGVTLLGAAMLRDGGGERSEAGVDAPVAAVVTSSAAEGSASPVPAISPQPPPSPSPRPTATAAPSPRATPTASPRPAATAAPPAPVAAEGIAGLLDQVMARSGYEPAGPVEPVPLEGGAALYVQRGVGADGQRLFIAVGDRYIGTDWEDASPLGVSNPRALGQGQFGATYANEPGQPSITVTFSWRGGRLVPSAVAPGHCQGRGC